MSRIRFLFFAFLLTTLQPLRAEKIDNRNFAIDTYYPTPNEIRLAEQRARKYWEKHAARFGSNPVYLAVETSKISAVLIIYWRRNPGHSTPAEAEPV